MGWSQDEFDFAEPRYLFNAVRGAQRRDMEQARLTAYYASLIHSPKGLRLTDFGLFPWEDESDYRPKFSKLDKDAFDRIAALQFPSDN